MNHIAPTAVLNAHALAGRMDQDGFAVVSNFLTHAALQTARDMVREHLARCRGESFFLMGNSALAGSVLRAIGASDEMRSLLADVFVSGTGMPAPQQPIYQTVRVVAGETQREFAWRFHYDAYVVTALLPIIVPEIPPYGSLVLYPRLRGIRSSVVLNFADKLMLQNKLACRLAAHAATRRLLGAKTLTVEPGHLYLFWGYQSLHGNEPCAPNAVRASALFHFGDPHAGAALTRAIERRRQRKEAATLLKRRSG